MHDLTFNWYKLGDSSKLCPMYKTQGYMSAHVLRRIWYKHRHSGILSEVQNNKVLYKSVHAFWLIDTLNTVVHNVISTKQHGCV